MKKLLCISLILLATFSCLTACNFTQNVSGALAGELEATPKVEELLTALAEKRISDAKAYIHPQKAEQSDVSIAQMSNYISGRKASAIEPESINVNTSTGTSGKIRQEQVIYRVTLNDGDAIYLNVVYLSNNTGTGFASFQLVLGIV